MTLVWALLTGAIKLDSESLPEPKAARMSTIQTTTGTPEHCIAGLTEFGPGRSKWHSVAIRGALPAPEGASAGRFHKYDS